MVEVADSRSEVCRLLPKSPGLSGISRLVGTVGTQDVAEAIVRVAERDSRGATLPRQLSAMRALHAVAPAVGTAGWKRPEQPATKARA